MAVQLLHNAPSNPKGATNYERRDFLLVKELIEEIEPSERKVKELKLLEKTNIILNKLEAANAAKSQRYEVKTKGK